MAHLASAWKNMRKSAKRRQWNKARRSEAKTYVKRFRAALSAGDVAKAREELRLAMKTLDKAAKRRAIHPNSAARHKSVLSRALAGLAKTAAKK
ncbi:MAG TPA: 30S ribosomal protein S20 [Planctomycetota bacterium]|jgi:small subunit ribosomal protein S20|nr:30S ribosomal protein S20 [Planctomycetota bacterium]